MLKKIILIILVCLSFNIFALNNTSPILVTGLPDFSAIYDKVGKSVVNITVTQIVQQPGTAQADPTYDFYSKRMQPSGQPPRQYKAHGLGSGFIISSDGYILTNAHVVLNTEKVTVKLNDKRELKAKIIGVDKNTDVAVLKIDASNLPAVKIGDPNKMKPGNWVVAIGAPFGLDNTITQGVISALSRDLSDDSYIPFLQTDVPINPGNSGGPLINLRGEVIGMNSQIYSNSGGYMGISFSIPIDYAMRIATQLRNTGHVNRGRLGIAIQSVTDELARSFGLAATKGVLVNSVESGSAAARAGIQTGDIILKANGQELNQTSALPRIVGDLGPDKVINLDIWRNGKVIHLHAKTTKAVDSDPALKDITNDSQNVQVVNSLGLIVNQLTRSQLPNGVAFALVVQDVSANAQFAGIVPGDLIVGVGNKNLNSFNDLATILKQSKVGNVIALKILRSDGQEMISLFVPVTITNKE
jgi:serine protease Do